MKKLLFAFAALAAILSPAAGLCDETFERALSLASEKHYSEAREVLDSLLEREPGHPRARLLHGILRARTGHVSEAIDIFEALRLDHPDMSEPYNNLAVLYAVQDRLDDARKTLLAALERQPDAVVYANLGDVYTKLARRAYEQARELELGSGASPEQTKDRAIALPGTPIGSSATESIKTEPRDSMTEPKAPAMVSQNGTTKPQEPVMESPGAAMELRKPAMESPDAMPGSQEPVTNLPSAAVKLRKSVTEPPEPEGASAGTPVAASEPVSMPLAFCARAGGFEGRRAVADAALWLQSYGAEVIEVRHEEHQVASSYRVYLPPFASREEAAAKMREIRSRGVRDVAVIQDGALANGISFGIYSKADNVHRRVAALDRLGYAVRSLVDDVKTVEEYVLKVRASVAPTALDSAWASRFPGHSLELVDCG